VQSDIIGDSLPYSTSPGVQISAVYEVWLVTIFVDIQIEVSYNSFIATQLENMIW